MRLLYSALLVLLLPLLVLRLVWRSRNAPAYRKRLGERLGLIALPDDPRPTIWIHAVSLGETLAARPLVERILAELPDYRVLVTTTTPTGSAQVRRLFGDRVAHVYAPWDTPGAVQRFLHRARPALLVLMETELWPNMLHYCAATGCRVMLANARLSARSAAGYARFARTTADMLQRIDWIGAQSTADADRFLQLGMGAPRLRVSGNIKFDIALDDGLRASAAALRGSWGDPRPTVIVASTHEGEDEIALEAFERVRERQPAALMLLAPRHPERFERVATRIESRHLPMQRYSAGHDLKEDTAVLLIDSVGELLLLFGVADVAVIGGSFIDHGGHNPLEAAAWGLPVISGPSMFNFTEVTLRLQEAGALEQAVDVAGLAGGVTALFDDPEQARRRGDAARRVLDANRGALEALFGAVKELLAAHR